MTVHEVRREDGAEAWPRRRDLPELEELVVMDLRRGSVVGRWVGVGLSGEGRTVDTVEIWSARFNAAGVCLDFRGRLEVVLCARMVFRSSSKEFTRNASPKALSVRFMIEIGKGKLKNEAERWRRKKKALCYEQGAGKKVLSKNE